MRVAGAYTYARWFDRSALSLRIYLYSIECSHLAPLALSLFLSLSFSFTSNYVRTKGEKNVKSPRPHPFHARGTLSIFSTWHRRNLYQNRSTVIFPPDEKMRRANVPSLLTRPFASGKLPTRGNKCWYDRMNLIPARTQFNKMYGIKKLFN